MLFLHKTLCALLLKSAISSLVLCFVLLVDQNGTILGEVGKLHEIKNHQYAHSKFLFKEQKENIVKSNNVFYCFFTFLPSDFSSFTCTHKCVNIYIFSSINR